MMRLVCVRQACKLAASGGNFKRGLRVFLRAKQRVGCRVRFFLTLIGPCASMRPASSRRLGVFDHRDEKSWAASESFIRSRKGTFAMERASLRGFLFSSLHQSPQEQHTDDTSCPVFANIGDSEEDSCRCHTARSSGSATQMATGLSRNPPKPPCASTIRP